MIFDYFRQRPRPDELERDRLNEVQHLIKQYERSKWHYDYIHKHGREPDYHPQANVPSHWPRPEHIRELLEGVMTREEYVLWKLGQ